MSAFLTQIDGNPHVIGHNFFMWVDEPAGGLGSGATGEDGNYGLVNAAGTPYSEVVDAFVRYRTGKSGGAMMRGVGER